MTRTSVKDEACQIVDRLPEDATWEDLRSEISFRQAAEAGLKEPCEDRPEPVEKVRGTLDRLSHSAGLAPDDVLREALALYARDLEDRQAAERIAPSTAELKAILARNPRPSSWHDSDEPFSWGGYVPLEFGQIVIVSEMTDPNGVNPKDRPSVVVTPTVEIVPEGPVIVIAISTLLPGPTPDDCVELPMGAAWPSAHGPSDALRRGPDRPDSSFDRHSPRQSTPGDRGQDGGVAGPRIAPRSGRDQNGHVLDGPGTGWASGWSCRPVGPACKVAVRP